MPEAKFRLARHVAEDLEQAELIVVKPAVRPNSPWLKSAVRCGVQITSEIDLFLGSCTVRVIGVTAPNGKSTTASILHAILTNSCFKGWIGGTIGGTLLPRLEQIEPDHLVVLELNSFQLHWLSPDARLPELLRVTNVQPNYLDRHGDFAAYAGPRCGCSKA